jgi:death on curing protein
LNAIRFLILKEVLSLHEKGMSFGSKGEGYDAEKLHASLAQPIWENAYGEQCLKRLASYYLYYITKDHPFTDGNKRVALASALTFLRLNGVTDTLDHILLQEFVWKISSEPIDKNACADQFVKLFTQELF